MVLVDCFYEVGGSADILSPALSFAGEKQGNTCPVMVPLDYMVDVEIFLQAQGIQTMNDFIVDEVYHFDIAKPHYKLVLRLLRQEFGLQPV